jgi:glycosyltransferase involved in cell wall biosynthesis
VDVFPLRAYLAGKVAGVKRIYGIEHITAEPIPPKVVGSGLWNLTRRLGGYRARYLMTNVSRIWLAGMLCNRTICVSYAIRERLVHEYGFSPERTVTIANGVDLKYYDMADQKGLNQENPYLNFDPNKTVIVCLARLVPRKRIDVLLEALSLLTKDGISYKCLIVGSGPLESELRERPGVLGISEHVDFVGYAGDVRPYLSMANIYVAPSDKEGLPLTLIEAMASGLPCIATNIAGHNEVVINGSTGLLIPPGAPREMAEAIKYLMTHKEERIRMGFNGRKRVEDFFDIENSMAGIIQVLLDDISPGVHKSSYHFEEVLPQEILHPVDR